MKTVIIMLLFTLGVGLSLFGIEICIIFTSTSVFIIVIVVLIILIIITVFIKSLTSEEKNSSGNNSLADIMTNLKINCQEGLGVLIHFSIWIIRNNWWVKEIEKTVSLDLFGDGSNTSF